MKNTLWKIINFCLSRLFANPSMHQVLALNDRELIDYQSYLRSHQKSVRSPEPKGDSFAGKWSGLRVVQQFFQLPCTAATRKARVDYIFAQGCRDRSILLIGDDDLVSVELCRQGASQVSVIDCDRRVLTHIASRTAGLPNRPELHNEDISAPYFVPPVKADLVVIDPPYNEAWVKLFLETARRSLRIQADGMIILMLNPTCFAGAARARLDRLLSSATLGIDEHRPHFNDYRLRGLNAVLLVLANGLVRRLGGPVYFGSDLFRLRANAKDALSFTTLANGHQEQVSTVSGQVSVPSG